MSKISWKSALDLFATVSMIAASGFLIWFVLPTKRAQLPPAASLSAPLEPIALGAKTKGNLAAPIGLVVFSDFLCPYCGAFAADVMPTINRKYVDSQKLVISFRDFPLEALHPLAFAAASAADCAARQDKFWPMHDQLFLRQGELTRASLSIAARDSGISMPQFEKCRANTDGVEIRNSIAEGTRLGIHSTPTFMIGRVVNGSVKVSTVLAGGLSLDNLEKAMEALLADQPKSLSVTK